MKKKTTTKIYQNQNRRVGHQTNTCKARLVHVILGQIALLLHAKIYNVVDYHEPVGRVYTSYNTITINILCNS